MKLVYTRWKDVKKFLRTIDEPLGEFIIKISVRKEFSEIGLEMLTFYDVEIPQEYIT